MSKILFERKKGKATIINQLSYPESVNERVYAAIASGTVEGIIPLTIQQKRKEIRLECLVQDLIPLSQYFGGVVTKQMFLTLVHQVAMQIKNCEKNMINANNLDLQGDKIFIDPQTKRVQCIFWPVVNNQRALSPDQFLKQLPYELNFSPQEDGSYLATYKAYFESNAPFSAGTFDRLVIQLLNQPSAAQPEAEPSAPHEPAATTNSSPYISAPSGRLTGNTGEEFVYCTTCGAKNKDQCVFCTTCGAKLKKKEPADEAVPATPATPAAEPSAPSFMIPPPPPPPTFTQAAVVPTPAAPPPVVETPPAFVVPTPAVEPPPAYAPPPMTDYTIVPGATTALGCTTGGTMVLGGGEPAAPVFPTLIRQKTGESHSIDKPTFRIGTEQSYCDLFIRDNTYISRSHADIVTRNGRYYIVDRNSTNKTYVDDRVIPIETEVELFPGSRVRLANEEFVFQY